jgi:hypothetical protein
MYFSNIMKSARHKSVVNACTYSRDAATLFELHLLERCNDNNCVGTFKSIFLEVGQHGTAITPSTPFQRPLPELAHWWYTTCLGLSGSVISSKPVEVLNLALQKKPKPCNMDAIQARLSKSIPDDPQEVERLMAMFLENSQQQVRQENIRMLENLARGSGTTVPPTELAPMVSPPAKRQRIAGTPKIELDDRPHLKQMTGATRLEFLLSKEAEFLAKAFGSKKNLTDGSKRWYNRSVTGPVFVFITTSTTIARPSCRNILERMEKSFLPALSTATA